MRDNKAAALEARSRSVRDRTMIVEDIKVEVEKVLRWSVAGVDRARRISDLVAKTSLDDLRLGTHDDDSAVNFGLDIGRAEEVCARASCIDCCLARAISCFARVCVLSLCLYTCASIVRPTSRWLGALVSSTRRVIGLTWFVCRFDIWELPALLVKRREQTQKQFYSAEEMKGRLADQTEEQDRRQDLLLDQLKEAEKMLKVTVFSALFFRVRCGGVRARVQEQIRLREEQQAASEESAKSLARLRSQVQKVPELCSKNTFRALLADSQCCRIRNGASWDTAIIWEIERAVVTVMTYRQKQNGRKRLVIIGNSAYLGQIWLRKHLFNENDSLVSSCFLWYDRSSPI